MILYNRLSRADLSTEQKLALKLMLMRMAIAVGDQKKLEHYSSEAVALGNDNQVLHRHVVFTLLHLGSSFYQQIRCS